jgi:hypothetical protein
MKVGGIVFFCLILICSAEKFQRGDKLYFKKGDIAISSSGNEYPAMRCLSSENCDQIHELECTYHQSEVDCRSNIWSCRNNWNETNLFSIKNEYIGCDGEEGYFDQNVLKPSCIASYEVFEITIVEKTMNQFINWQNEKIRSVYYFIRNSTRSIFMSYF